MDLAGLLGESADELLTYECKGIARDELVLPGPDFIERVFLDTDRPLQVLRSLQSLFDHGRLGGTGYVSILPVDQGIEHSAAASSPPIPATSTPRTSSSWPSRPGATPSPPPSGCSASPPVATPTASPTSSSSTTTSS